MNKAEQGRFEIGENQTEKRPMVAFGRFVKPEMYDIFGDYDLSGLTDAEKVWMSANRIAEAIFLPPRTEESLVVDRVGLNSYEYGLITRSPIALARTAVQRVLKDNDLDDERMAASQRAPEHAFKAKLGPMTEHLEKLKEARVDVHDLNREAKKPGYAHKSETWMKEHLSVVWLEFQTMLDVLHVQRGWDDEKRNRAQAALINYLTQGSQRSRVGHWQAMIELADNYLGARITLFSNRTKDLRTRLSSTIDEQPTD